MLQRLTLIAILAVACQAQTAAPKFPSHPDFKPAPEVPAMPKALMKLPRTEITRATFPALDFHLHGGTLKTAAVYEKMIALMDKTGVGLICNMDGGFGKNFDRSMQVGEPYRDRIIHFARLNWEGINEPGWSQRTTAELERCFRAQARYDPPQRFVRPLPSNRS
jgi:hypothetical protein